MLSHYSSALLSKFGRFHYDIICKNWFIQHFVNWKFVHLCFSVFPDRVSCGVWSLGHTRTLKCLCRDWEGTDAYAKGAPWGCRLGFIQICMVYAQRSTWPLVGICRMSPYGLYLLIRRKKNMHQDSWVLTLCSVPQDPLESFKAGELSSKLS